MNALVIDRLTKRFGGVLAVDDVTLEVRPGERRAILGPNGAGKSTLFNLIGGQLPATSGRILLFDQDITKLPPYQRVARGISRTFQITNLFPRLSLLQNIMLGVQGVSAAKFSMYRPMRSYKHIVQRAESLLEQWDILAKQDIAVHDLSYGDQRKVEIVMAVAGTPKVLLLDEPTAGLSLAESQLLTRTIRDLDPAITVLLIEHDMDVALDVAERITVLHNGAVVADGTRDEVRNDPHLEEIYFGGKVRRREPDSAEPPTSMDAPPRERQIRGCGC